MKGQSVASKVIDFFPGIEKVILFEELYSAYMNWVIELFAIKNLITVFLKGSKQIDFNIITELFNQLQINLPSPACFFLFINELKQSLENFQDVDSADREKIIALLDSTQKNIKRNCGKLTFYTDIMLMICLFSKRDISDEELLIGIKIYQNKKTIPTLKYNKILTLLNKFLKEKSNEILIEDSELEKLIADIDFISKTDNSREKEKSLIGKLFNDFGIFSISPISDSFRKEIRNFVKLVTDEFKQKQISKSNKIMAFLALFSNLPFAESQSLFTNYGASSNNTQTYTGTLGANGNTIECGQVFGSSNGPMGFCRKIDETGVEIESYVLNDGTINNLEKITMIEKVPSGGYIGVAEVVTPILSDQIKPVFFKIDSQFNLNYIKIIDDSTANKEIPKALLIKSNGSFLLAGTTDGNGFIINFAPNGSAIWRKQIPLLSDINSLILNNDGTYTVIGSDDNNTYFCVLDDFGDLSTCKRLPDITPIDNDGEWMLGKNKKEQSILIRFNLHSTTGYEIQQSFQLTDGRADKVSKTENGSDDVVVFGVNSNGVFSTQLDVNGNVIESKLLGNDQGNTTVSYATPNPPKMEFGVNNPSQFQPSSRVGNIILNNSESFCGGDPTNVAFSEITLTLNDTTTPTSVNWAPDITNVAIGLTNGTLPISIDCSQQFTAPTDSPSTTGGQTTGMTTGLTTTGATTDLITTGSLTTDNPTSSTTGENRGGSGSDNTGLAVGLTFMFLILFLAGGGLAFYFWRKKIKTRDRKESVASPEEFLSSINDENDSQGERRNKTDSVRIKPKDNKSKNFFELPRRKVQIGDYLIEILENIKKSEALQLIKTGKLILFPKPYVPDTDLEKLSTTREAYLNTATQIANDQNQLIEMNHLGAGNFGQVYIGLWEKKSEQNFYALKFTEYAEEEGEEEESSNKEDIIQSKLKGSEFFVEIYFSAVIKHPTKHQSTLALLMPLALGDLKIISGLLYGEKDPRIKLNLIPDFLKLFDALKFMHDKKIIHGDLKPRNILFFIEDNQLKLKITDLGCAVEIDGDEFQLPHSVMGDNNYNSSEKNLAIKYKTSYNGIYDDLFRLVVTLWETWLGELPFPRYNNLNELYARDDQYFQTKFEDSFKTESSDEYFFTLMRNIIYRKILTSKEAVLFIEEQKKNINLRRSQPSLFGFSRLLESHYKKCLSELEWFTRAPIEVQENLIKILVSRNNYKQIDDAVDQILQTESVKKELSGLRKLAREKKIQEFYNNINDIVNFSSKFLSLPSSKEESTSGQNSDEPINKEEAPNYNIPQHNDDNLNSMYNNTDSREQSPTLFQRAKVKIKKSPSPLRKRHEDDDKEEKKKSGTEFYNV